MSSNTELRWGIIGCGVISHDFALSLQASKYPHKIVATAASSQERSECFAKKVDAPGAKSYDSYADLIADPNVDIVYIGLVNHLHLEWTLKAIEGNKHVLCEKPWTCNTAEMKQILDKAKTTKKFVMEAVWTRFFPAWKKIKELIASKELGEVRVFGANFGMPVADNRFNRSIGQSPLIDIGIYTVSCAMFVFGDEKPEEMHIVGHKNADGCDIWANITLKYSDGRHAVLYYNGVQSTTTSAFVSFEKGQAELPHHFWCPEALTVYPSGKGTPDAKEQHHEWKLEDKQSYNIPHDEGLSYEADHCASMISQGAHESDVMPLESSWKLAQVMEELRNKLNVTYKQD